MLILQRKKGQSLSLGDDITLSVSEVGNDWVKLAIEAPKTIPVLRTELKEAAAENKKASADIPASVLRQIIKESSED